MAYVDPKSAFDSVDRSALWLALKGIGVPDFLLHLLQDLHHGSGTRVRISGTTSDRFCTTSGVRQGCILAPALFCRAIDWIMEHMQGLGGVMVGVHQFSDLDYADDIALPAANKDQLTSSLAGFSAAAGSVGLNVSWQKTKVQSISVTGPPDIIFWLIDTPWSLLISSVTLVVSLILPAGADQICCVESGLHHRP